MRNTVKNFVVKYLLDILQGKCEDTKIYNVRLFWHGEFGPIPQCFLHVMSKKGDEVVDFEDYMTHMDHKEWFNAMVEDITNVVMELVDPDEVDKVDIVVDEMKSIYFNIK